MSVQVRQRALTHVSSGSMQLGGKAVSCVRGSVDPPCRNRLHAQVKLGGHGM